MTPTQTGLVLSIGNTLFVIAVSSVWLRESPSSRAVVGIAVALSAVVLFYYPWAIGDTNLLGIAFITLSSAGYAINLTATRKLIAGHRATTGS